MKTEYEKLNKEHQEAAQADMDKRLYADFDEDDINFIKNQMEALHERGIQCYSFCQLIDKNGKECVVQFNNQNMFMYYDQKDNISVGSKIKNTIFNTLMASSIIMHYANMFNTNNLSYIMQYLGMCHEYARKYRFEDTDWGDLKELKEELNNSGKEEK